MKKLHILILSLFICFSSVFADIFMKQKQHTDEVKMMGQTQPASDVESKVWMTADGMRSDNEKQSVIMNLKIKEMINLDHEKKKYMIIPMDFEEMMEQSEGEKPSKEDMDAMQNMFGGMMSSSEPSVTVTSETQKINGWKCKKYLLNMKIMMTTIESEIWATEDLKADKKLYAKYSTSAYAMMPGMQEGMENLIKEMKKIKGVQVLTKTTTKVMGSSFGSTTELLEYKTGKAPSGLFDIPKGYKKQRM